MIRWISNSLGTAPIEDVPRESDVVIFDIRSHVDKAGNTPRDVRRDLDAVVALLEDGKRVVICCDHGISRSNAFASGVLSLVDGLSFTEAVRMVMAVTGEKAIRIEVLESVREALGNVKACERGEKRRVLVAGAGGDVGNYLVPMLSDEFDLYLPTRDELDFSAGSAEGSLYLYEHEIDAMVLLAQPRVFSINSAVGEGLIIVKNAVDACARSGVYLLYPSSSAVFSGCREKGSLVSESAAQLPEGPYGETKYFAEMLIDLYRSRHGLNSGVVRFGHLYGARAIKPAFLWSFVESVMAGRKIVTHRYLNGRALVDLLHLDDACSGLRLVLRDRATGIFHFGNGEGITTRALSTMLFETIGRTPKLDERKIDAFGSNAVLDSSYSRRRFRWRPSVDLPNGLRELILERKSNV